MKRELESKISQLEAEVGLKADYIKRLEVEIAELKRESIAVALLTAEEQE